MRGYEIWPCGGPVLHCPMGRLLDWTAKSPRLKNSHGPNHPGLRHVLISQKGRRPNASKNIHILDRERLENLGTRQGDTCLTPWAKPFEKWVWEQQSLKILGTHLSLDMCSIPASRGPQVTFTKEFESNFEPFVHDGSPSVHFLDPLLPGWLWNLQKTTRHQCYSNHPLLKMKAWAFLSRRWPCIPLGKNYYIWSQCDTDTCRHRVCWTAYE